jgi:hypothetical protein
MEKGDDIKSLKSLKFKEIEIQPETNLEIVEIVNPHNINVILVPESKNSLNPTNNVTPIIINTPVDVKSDMTKKMHLEKLDMTDRLLFVFVNPRSGSEEGKIIFNIVQKQNISKKGYRLLDFDVNEIKFASYYFNIVDKTDYEIGCSLLDDYLFHSDENIKFKILVAGGDGTVLSVIEDLNSKGIDINRCVFGHIPLGTGNDLSNALGFGCK